MIQCRKDLQMNIRKAVSIMKNSRLKKLLLLMLGCSVAAAGLSGRAVTFVEEERRQMMKGLVKRAVAANQHIKTRVVSKGVGTGILHVNGMTD